MTSATSMIMEQAVMPKDTTKYNHRHQSCCCSHLCPKGGLNYFSKWFISPKFEDKKTLKIVAGLDKSDIGVIGGRKGS